MNKVMRKAMALLVIHTCALYAPAEWDRGLSPELGLIATHPALRPREVQLMGPDGLSTPSIKDQMVLSRPVTNDEADAYVKLSELKRIRQAEQDGYPLSAEDQQFLAQNRLTVSDVMRAHTAQDKLQYQQKVAEVQAYNADLQAMTSKEKMALKQAYDEERAFREQEEKARLSANQQLAQEEADERKADYVWAETGVRPQTLRDKEIEMAQMRAEERATAEKLGAGFYQAGDELTEFVEPRDTMYREQKWAISTAGEDAEE